MALACPASCASTIVPCSRSITPTASCDTKKVRTIRSTPRVPPAVSWLANPPQRQRVLLRLLQPGGIAAKLRHGKTAAGESSGGSELQGPAVHRRGDPLGSPLVPNVPDQLPRSRVHARRPRRHHRTHHDLPLNPGLCGRAGEADPSPPASEQWLVAGRRDVCEGDGPLDLPIPRGRQPRLGHRLPALGQAGHRGGKALLPQSTGAAAHGEPTYHHGGQGTPCDRQRRRLPELPRGRRRLEQISFLAELPVSCAAS